MLHEPVAQRTEQEFPKLKVAGSIPAGLPLTHTLIFESLC